MGRARSKVYSRFKKLLEVPRAPLPQGVVVGKVNSRYAGELGAMECLGTWDGPSVRYKNKRGVDPNIEKRFERDLKEIVTVGGCDPRDRWGIAPVDVASVYVNVAKYQRLQPSNYDQGAWRKAVEALRMVLKRAIPECREYSFEEAIAAFPRGTSPGPELAEFGVSKGEILDDPEALEILRRFDAELDHRTASRAVPKEEIRPIEKIVLSDSGDNRSIVVQGMLNMVSEIRLWADQNRQMNSHWQSSWMPFKVGMSPFYAGWHEVNKGFLGRKVGTYDVSQRDASDSVLHQEAILQLRLERYGPETPNRGGLVAKAKFIESDAIWSVIVMPDGNVFGKDTGNTTGRFNTITNNGMCSFLDIAYAVFVLVPDLSPADFLARCLLAIVGDDVRFSPDEFLASLFVPSDLTRVLQQDLFVTIKWEHEQWSTLFDDVWLSTKTAPAEGGWLLPVPEDPSKMLASCYYGTPKSTPIETLQRLVNFRMLSFTVPALFTIFDRWTTELISEFNVDHRNSKEWGDLVQSVMSVPQLEHLYTGWEGVYTPPSVVLDLWNCMDESPWLSTLRPASPSNYDAKPVSVSDKQDQAIGRHQDPDLDEETVEWRRDLAQLWRENQIGNALWRERDRVDAVFWHGETPPPMRVARSWFSWSYLWIAFGLFLMFYGLMLDPRIEVRKDVKCSSVGTGQLVVHSGGRTSGSFEARAVEFSLEMTKAKKSRKPRSKMSKEKKKAKRKERRAKHKLRDADMAARLASATGGGDYMVRTDRRLRGRGDFFDDVIGTLGNIAGKGIKAANWISENGSFLLPLLGAGDYSGPAVHPKNNSLWANSSQPPNMHGSSFTGFRSRHREYIGDVWSSNSLQIQKFTFQPGLPKTFPWGNQQHNLYQRYFVDGAVIEFLSTCDVYGGGNIEGSVNICAQYDMSTPDPTLWVQMENIEGQVTCKPTQNAMMAFECAPKANPVNVLEIRSGALPASANTQFFDFCNFYVSNVGQTDGTLKIGQIYICYDIWCELPIDVVATNSQVLTDHFQLSGIDSSHQFGTTATPTSTSSLGGTVSTTAQTYTFPPFVAGGSWLVTLWYAAGASSSMVGPTYTYTGCSKLQVFSSTAGPDGWSSPQAPAGAVSSPYQMYQQVVSVTAPSAKIAISGSAFSGTVYGDLMVTMYDGDVVTLCRSKHRWQKHWKAIEDERVRNEEAMEALMTRKFRDMFINNKELMLQCWNTPGFSISNDYLVEEKYPPGSRTGAAIKEFLERKVPDVNPSDEDSPVLVPRKPTPVVQPLDPEGRVKRPP